MANTVIQIRSSGVVGNVPSALFPGELAINYEDGKLYYGNSANQTVLFDAITEPAGLNGELQFNDSGSFGSDATLSFNKTTGYFKAPIIESTNNGNGTNFKIGDDVWIGDVNIANTLRITGQQNVNNAYIIFGASDTSKLGRAGSGPLTYSGDFTATGVVSGNELTSTNSSGNEGGQVNLAIPASGTSLVGGVTIDVYQNQLRFFQGDSAKGAYIDLTAAASGVGTNLLNPAAASYANSAYLHANSAFAYANALSGGTATDGVARSIANSAYVQANASFQNSNSALSSATSAGSYANSAYIQANTATTNAATADQRAVTSGIFANAAYNQANTATTNAATADQRAVTSGSYANSAFIAANNAITYTDNAIANLVNSAPTTLDTLNELATALGDDPNFATTISTMVGVSGSYANSAYGQANTATTNAATADQRAVTSGVYANSAYDQANTADQKAVTSGDYANSAYSLANTTTLLAQAAFDKANTGTSLSTDDFARNQANTAYVQANTATVLAQAAFDVANTGGASPINITNDVLTDAEYYITFVESTSGIVTSLKTSNAPIGITKLTYNPYSGSLGVRAIDVTQNVSISSSSLEDTSGSQFLVDSFDVTTYRGAFYQVQIESPGQYQVLNLNIVHDGGTPTVLTFGNTYTSSSLGSFTANIVGGVLQVLFTPNVGQVIVSFVRNIIKKIRELIPAGDLGYVADTVSVSFDAGYVEDSSSSSFDYGGLN
jgi:hypothetical protein